MSGSGWAVQPTSCFHPGCTPQVGLLAAPWSWGGTGRHQALCSLASWCTLAGCSERLRQVSVAGPSLPPAAQENLSSQTPLGGEDGGAMIGQSPLSSLNSCGALGFGSMWGRGQTPATFSFFCVSSRFLPSLLSSQAKLSLVGVRDVGAEKWIAYYSTGKCGF